MSIHNLLQKINPLSLLTLISEKTRLDLIIIALLVMSGVLSFGVAKLSTTQNQPKQPVLIENAGNGLLQASSTQSIPKSSQNGNPTATSIPESGSTQAASVVASKQGTKYHFSWCSGAKTIASKNKITFATVEAAIKAGYTLAANCKASQ